MRFRAVWRLLRVVLHLLHGILTVAFVYRRSDTAKRLTLKQHWSAKLVKLLGIELKWSGHVSSGGLLVSNHISFVDVYAINAVMPSTFVAKDEVRTWPLIGWLAARADNLFLMRGSRRAAQRASEDMLEFLACGKRIAIFPEGTTSNGNAMLPFHSALFQAAIDAKADITPMAIAYTDKSGVHSHAADYVGETSLLECLWSIACADGITVTLTILSPLPASDGNRRHLSAHAHRVVLQQLSRMN